MEIRKKELKFKGKTLDELKTLDVREFAKLLKSRQRRTVLRNFQEHENFVKRAQEKFAKGKRLVKTHKRDLVIVPELVGMKLQIYNGRDFVPVEITFDMLGHKFGEFAPTRARAKHTKALGGKKVKVIK
ncbi:30S ribosomal protein S19 [archaeon]|jgi:small subunit ribosomal protein S19|nr:30S ribosomal protein S19 [archaeon]